MRAVKITLCLACLHFSALSSAAGASAPVAGTASIVAGAVSSIALDGSSRVLRKDDAVYSGDRIVTGAAGYVRLGFLDGGSMVLRPNTEFAIEGFDFQPSVVESAVKVVPPKTTAAAPALQIGSQSVGNRAFFRLVRGGFRAVTGLVGKISREEYAVRTPVATIGIRGTEFLTVFCDAICAADSMVQGSLPAGETALGGIVAAVDQGSIVIVSNAAKTAVVEPSQFVLTTASGTHVFLPGLPGFLGAENWLNAAQQAAAAPSATAPASQALASSALSTIPTIGSLAAVVLIGATALATDTQDDGRDGVGATPPATSTSPTGTGR